VFSGRGAGGFDWMGEAVSDRGARFTRARLLRIRNDNVTLSWVGDWIRAYQIDLLIGGKAVCEFCVMSKLVEAELHARTRNCGCIHDSVQSGIYSVHSWSSFRRISSSSY
jgi:hypothetical protein